MHPKNCKEKSWGLTIIIKFIIFCLFFFTTTPQGITDCEVPPLHVGRIVAKASAPVFIGTGFFVNESGLFLTAYHCVAGVEQIFVVTCFSPDTLFAELIDSLPKADLALLKVQLPTGKIPHFSTLYFLDLEFRFPFIVEVGFVISGDYDSTDWIIVRGVSVWVSHDTIYICTPHHLTTGHSGSPLVLYVMGKPTNILLGLLQSGQRCAILWSQSRRLVIAKSTFGVIPSHFIVQLLKRNNIQCAVKKVKKPLEFCVLCHQFTKNADQGDFKRVNIKY